MSFDGSGSTGNNLSYSWDFGTDATPPTGSGVTPSCSYSTSGTKTVTLTVTSGAISRSATVPITVHTPPIANAGSDQIVAFGSEVSFDGSGSIDPDGGDLTYSWDFGTDADPATSSAVTPFCLYGSTGDKTVTLTVTDDEGVSRSDTVTITVHDPPIADAGPDQIVTVDTEVSFDGSGSRDPDGGELTYSWDFGADAVPATGSGVTPSCSYTMTGAKTATLTVTDDEGVSRSDTVTITVHDPPVADAGSDQIVTFGSEVSFDGSGSTGNNLSYLWDFGTDADPATSNSDKPFCLYGSTGAKTVTLTVTDRDTGRTDSDTVTITVIDVGVTVTGAPRVVAAIPATRVGFEGTVSNAPEEATLNYSWNFGDGAIFLRNVNGLMPSCQYVTPGDKTVTLTVGVTIGEQTVEVEGTCVIKVFKAYAGDFQIVAVGDTVDFTGRVENAPDGADLSYSWAFGDGAANAEDDDGLTPSCSYTTAGDKTVTLTVSFTLDGESIEGSGTVKITVLESQLRVQGPRGLSPLEKAAVQLVFGNSIDPDALSQGVTVRVDEVVTSAGVGVAGSYGAGIIKISRVKHQFAEELDGDTTVDDIDLTIPNNIKYLATLVHEVGHHWQSIKERYNAVRIPKYDFNNEVLESLDFVCKEEHAAAGQVYFILKWQLHHGHDPINITDSGFAYKNVGPVNRYASIADIPPINRG